MNDSREARAALELIPDSPWGIAKHVFVIAEIGINHNGDLALAKKLIDVAAAAGCDAVKFQKRTIDRVYTPEFLDSPRVSPWGTTQREQKEGLEFDTNQFRQLDQHCRSLGIEWFASAWDVESQKFLRQFGLNYNKIASPMLTHREVCETVAQEGKLTFVSTGMSSQAEIHSAVRIFERHGCPIVLMHCISEYPPEDGSLHLRSLADLSARYGAPVGYSGHESTVLPSVLAAAWGAVAIERHLTLDRSMYGSDQAASITPDELSELVTAVRAIPAMHGAGQRKVTADETKNARKLRYWAPASTETVSIA